jgi:hypothetical protein
VHKCVKSVMENVRNNTSTNYSTPFKGFDGVKSSKVPGTASSTSSSLTQSRIALDSAKNAVLQKTAEKRAKVAHLKEVWAKEKQERLAKRKEQHDVELERRKLTQSIIASQRMKNLERQRQIQDRKGLEIQQQLAANNDANRQCAIDMSEKAKARRRQSVMLNREILSRAAQRAAEIELQRAQEKALDAELKSKDAAAVRLAKQKEDERRRDSLAAKTDRARLVSELERSRREEESEKAKDVFQFRYTAWVDEKKAEEAAKLTDRAALQARLADWQRAREAKERSKVEEDSEVSIILEERKEYSQVAEKQKQEQRMRMRESLAGRLDEWRKGKSLVEEQDEADKQAQQIELELLEQERCDVENYKMRCRQNRRESMAGRIEKAKLDKDWERGQAELVVLAFESERDAHEEDMLELKKYKQEEDSRRKESLLGRAQAAHHEKEVDGEAALHEKEILLSDWALKQLDWEEVNAEKAAEKATARQSLACRLVQKKYEKEAELMLHQARLNELHTDLLARRNDAIDVAEYKQKAVENRRKSVAFRLDSWRQQKLKQAKEEQKRRVQYEQDRLLDERAREDIERAKIALRDEAALDRLLPNFVN